QAEDGIRDRNVTGVQTCALPIYFFEGVGHSVAKIENPARASIVAINFLALVTHYDRSFETTMRSDQLVELSAATSQKSASPSERSEERRVGKSVELGSRRITKRI